MVKQREQPTRRHERKEKKAASKKESKEKLSDVRKKLTTTEKSKVNPLLPIAATRCNQCGEGFNSVMAAGMHRVHKHPGCKRRCPNSTAKKPTCGCIYSSRRQLTMHMDYHQTGAVPIEEEGSEEEEEMPEEEEEEM